MNIVLPITVNESNLTTNVGNEHADWAAGSYAEGDKVVFEEFIYEALTATSDQPDEGAAKDTPTWVRLGRANMWRMWRDGADSRSKRDSDIEVTIPLTNVATTVGLVGLQGTEAQVTLTDSEEGVVYDQTQTITDISAKDWWEWYFGTYNAKSSVVFDDLPSYGDADLMIKITGTESNEVQVGRAIIGQQSSLGVTLEGVDVRSEDYSKKQRDTFGNLELVPRRTIKLMEYDVRMEPTAVDFVERRLSSVAAMPTLFIGDPTMPESIVFGVYEDFTIVVNGYTITEASIAVQEF